MKVKEIAILIDCLTPHERRTLGEMLVMELTPTKVGELFTGLSQIGERSPFNHTGKSGYLGHIIGDAAKRLMTEGMFCHTHPQTDLF